MILEPWQYNSQGFFICAIDGRLIKNIKAPETICSKIATDLKDVTGGRHLANSHRSSAIGYGQRPTDNEFP